jgi:putative FmdB family regulatory protein
MPIHEYQCIKCGYIFEEVTFSLDAVKISTGCKNCVDSNGNPSIARKIMSGGTFFTIHGYNSNNGYAGHMR